MPRKINARLIILLLSSGQSTNKIASQFHVSKHSILEVKTRQQQAQITSEEAEKMDEDSVYRLLFPDRYTDENVFHPVDYEYVHKELLRSGTTLKLLWKEYKLDIPDGRLPVSYSKFCEDYNNFVGTHQYTNHIDHKPGERIEVDWSGPTMKYEDCYTGEMVKVYLFVATLPFSQYTYVEPTLDMKMDTWILCNVHMFEFIQGTTRRVICDNLKTGVVSHTREGEITLTETYQNFGDHYLTAIMPAGVKKPKQKASVEGSVGKIGTHIIAALRNEHFHSLKELKDSVSKRLESFNNEPFEKREGSRKSVFENEEKQFLRPLPAIPFEIFEWVYGRKVMNDCHISFQKNRYSVPYRYVGKNVDLKVTTRFIEIYHYGLRLTSHPRFPEYMKNRYSTHEEDMPKSVKVNEWDDTRIKKWAEQIGPSTKETVDIIFEIVKIKEQAYNPSLSILNLSKKYGEERLEKACQLALKHYRSPRYKHLKGILSNNQDLIDTEVSVSKQETVFTRGAEYYGGKR